jgi:hypothetical protein
MLRRAAWGALRAAYHVRASGEPPRGRRAAQPLRARAAPPWVRFGPVRRQGVVGTGAWAGWAAEGWGRGRKGRRDGRAKTRRSAGGGRVQVGLGAVGGAFVSALTLTNAVSQIHERTGVELSDDEVQELTDAEAGTILDGAATGLGCWVWYNALEKVAGWVSARRGVALYLPSGLLRGGLVMGGAGLAVCMGVELLQLGLAYVEDATWDRLETAEHEALIVTMLQFGRLSPTNEPGVFRVSEIPAPLADTIDALDAERRAHDAMEGEFGPWASVVVPLALFNYALVPLRWRGTVGLLQHLVAHQWRDGARRIQVADQAMLEAMAHGEDTLLLQDDDDAPQEAEGSAPAGQRAQDPAGWAADEDGMTMEESKYGTGWTRVMNVTKEVVLKSSQALLTPKQQLPPVPTLPHGDWTDTHEAAHTGADRIRNVPPPIDPETVFHLAEAMPLPDPTAAQRKERAGTPRGVHVVRQQTAAAVLVDHILGLQNTPVALLRRSPHGVGLDKDYLRKTLQSEFGNADFDWVLDDSDKRLYYLVVAEAEGDDPQLTNVATDLRNFLLRNGAKPVHVPAIGMPSKHINAPEDVALRYFHYTSRVKRDPRAGTTHATQILERKIRDRDSDGPRAP